MAIDYAEIGRRMAKRRKELKLKQYEVCEMVDVNYKYISNLETGRSAPSLEIIMKLCAVLQTTPDYFLLGVEKEKNSIDDRVLIDKISRLDEKSKRLLNGIIDVFADEG